MKTKNYFLILLTIMVAMMNLCLSSCGGDDDDNTNDNSNYNQNTSNPSADSALEDILFKTSWVQVSNFEYYNDGQQKQQSPRSGTLSFGKEGIAYFVNAGLNAETYSGTWYVSDEKIYAYPTDVSADVRGYLVAAGFSLLGYHIDELSSSELVCSSDLSTSRKVITFRNVSYVEGNTSGDNPSGGGSDDEVPHFVNFNYTATATSVTVKFYTDVRATSATIKYGESSPSSSVSANITNKEISATIRGLKKGTKYYVKCTARNASGSTTSDSYPVITNY